MIPTLQDFLRGKPAELSRGPIAIILCEDDVELDSTLDHAMHRGFDSILALSPEPLDPEILPDNARNLCFETRRRDAHVEAVNAVNDAARPGIWIHYGFNAEYLFFPFSESRRIGEMLRFHSEERRSAMLSYTVDLYAPDLERFPSGVSMDHAMFDATGYFALGRKNADGQIQERQLDFHGGLRWRFEEFIPEARRRIDRIALFRSRPGLRLLPDFRFDDEEYNTYACPWHNNLTAAIASFRAAKALARNPGSRDEINGFTWRNSREFDWTAQQLMDLGLMEPGQWF
ncbi:hypothetical protein SAMN05421538_104100 [Paracoccus isoporae]|uniref:Glycosyl transferase family 2 n=1 Tax=Paracoccus isoporae TaxID=591205 RepID=A0A1G7AD27_9RHOB|nr:hypothetical protein [Paracoccus isoporae]SDE12722.1 hypothetical protein SAMN05421538_104100 [Paracoccus isoporae]